ncbi:MAG TPA: (d)CMP kinase [Sporichthyaceae bacterium]|nr:(d)CMP kinase [Sporichthyaceae bacterium]
MESLVVAMDGPSGSGKSSVSRAVASELGVRYLDTGAMYRAVTWWMLREGVDLNDPVAVSAAADKPTLCSGTDPADPSITVDGIDVSGSIRSREVTGAVSAVSAVPAVRTRLVAMQQAIIARCCADDGGIVVEGRDIGTVVAPQAPVKMYLTASVEARAGRRNAETTVETVPVEVTRDELARRDQLDSTRAVAPLARATDAIELDTTALSQQQVVDAVLAQVRRVVEPVSGDLAH